MNNSLVSTPAPPRVAALFALAALTLSSCSEKSGEAQSDPKPASLTMQRNPAGQWELLRDGKPFFIRGAGGSEHLDLLVESGGNAIRTWGVGDLASTVNGQTLVNRARDRDLMIAAGLWVEHARHGFNYDDPRHIEGQRQKIRRAVSEWKHVPAIGFWGLGNEMEDDGKDVRVWKELEELAKIVKAEDPSRLVMTVIAGAAPEKIKGIVTHCPSIDILGINAYGGALEVAGAAKRGGWDKPYLLTEFGPLGHWEVPKTDWGAPLEPSSEEKEARYLAAQQHVAKKPHGLAVGSFTFFWGQKQERTPTWYSMFLQSGEKLPPVDAMAKAWTGEWPAQRCPQITTFTTPSNAGSVEAGSTVEFTFAATDPEGSELQLAWTVSPEATDVKTGGDRESVPPATEVEVTNLGDERWSFPAPAKPGNYRLFLVVRDGSGAANTANFPFRVQ